MRVIKADHERRLALPGVPSPVLRPVDIDPTKTGFANLRSLRIYRFERGTTIDGHAEEDEVFVVVMAGSIEFTASGDNSGKESRSFVLSALNNSQAGPCVAYLPPQSAYRLIPKTDSEIAYARATPASGTPAAVFSPRRRMDAAGVTVLLEEEKYPQRLRLRLVNINAAQSDVDFAPIHESEGMYEALIHVRAIRPEAIATLKSGEDSTEDDRIVLDSWDTIAIAPGDRPALHVAAGSSLLLLLVLAV